MNKWINQRCCTFRVSHVTDTKGIPTSQGYEDYKMKQAKHIRQRNSQWWLLLEQTSPLKQSFRNRTSLITCTVPHWGQTVALASWMHWCCIWFLTTMGDNRLSKQSWASGKKRKAITPEIHTDNPSYTHFTYINLAFKVKVKSFFVHSTP